jgi:hypothetical protein
VLDPLVEGCQKALAPLPLILQPPADVVRSRSSALLPNSVQHHQNTNALDLLQGPGNDFCCFPGAEGRERPVAVGIGVAQDLFDDQAVLVTGRCCFGLEVLSYRGDFGVGSRYFFDLGDELQKLFILALHWYKL